MKKAKGQYFNGISEEDLAQGKAKRQGTSCNPFKLRRDEKDADEIRGETLVEFQPATDWGTKPRPSLGFEETSEVPTPISPHALKLFQAIREDEMDLVEEELASLTDKRKIDKLGGHGFALIHVAARYNFGRIVNSLLDRGADINVGTSEYQWTPLHLASRWVKPCSVCNFFLLA